MSVPKSLALEDFDVKYLGKKLYELTLKSPHYVAQTGAAVTKNYRFPFAHRLVRVEVKHCDGSDADNTDAFAWSLSKQIVKGLFIALVAYSASTGTDFIEPFGEKFEFATMLYRFITNTTNGHRVYLKMIIQLLE